MRIKEVLTEAIQNTPRNMVVYLKMCAKRVAQMEAVGNEIVALGSKAFSNPEVWDDISRTYARVIENEEHWQMANNIEYLVRRLKDRDSYDNPTTRLKDYISTMQTSDSRYFSEAVNHFISSFKFIDDRMHQPAKLVALGDYYDQLVERHTDAGYLDPKYMDESELAAHKAGLELFAKVAEFGKLWGELYTDMIPKLTEFLRKYRPVLDDKERRPSHDEVETLYHASAFAADIAREGFQEKRPDDRQGLGYFGTVTDVISFTHDLYVAKELSRALKEVVMIANGELTFRQILDWCKRDGAFDDRLEKHFNGDFNRMLQVDCSVENPQNPTLKDVARLYNRYLFMNKTIRSNPWFTGVEALIPMFKGRSVKDVGVLACEVRLTGEEEYKHGEAEFVVKPSQVLSIKRVI